MEHVIFELKKKYIYREKRGVWNFSAKENHESWKINNKEGFQKNVFFSLKPVNKEGIGSCMVFVCMINRLRTLEVDSY